MIYLIGQLWVWLLLTALSAAVAGWAFAAERAAPAQRAMRRDRENLLSDLIRLTGDDGAGASNGALENEREADATRRLLVIRDGRIAELEHALDTARARADDLSGELAELRRTGPGEDTDQAEELRRLRGLVADNETERARTIDVETTPDPVVEENAALQLWRLRYFEQRVRYLETQSRAQPVAVLEAPETDPLPDWRLRDAEARVAYLENALREAQTAPAVAEVTHAEPAASPFAADADVDVLLRWRLLYLERRVAHLQSAATRAPVAPMPVLEAAPDLDRWKWRARYLESRVRHLEQRAPIVEAPRAVMPDVVEHDAAPPPAPSRRGVKPPVLGSARNGAPDDFTLIEGVSLQQQSTLYSLGVFHFDQIAAWTPDHVAWVDNYLRLRGRIADQEWLEQADDLARDGPNAARRAIEEAL